MREHTLQDGQPACKSVNLEAVSSQQGAASPWRSWAFPSRLKVHGILRWDCLRIPNNNSIEPLSPERRLLAKEQIGTSRQAALGDVFGRFKAKSSEKCPVLRCAGITVMPRNIENICLNPHSYHAPSRCSSHSRPWSVNRYRCKGLRGRSGRVISMSFSAKAGLR